MKIGWGLDVGVASLGFAVIELDENNQPKNLLDGVSVVYPAPIGAAERTGFKSSRTLNQRTSRRIKGIRKSLIDLFDLEADFDAEHSWPDLTDGIAKDGSPRRNNSRVRLRAYGLTGQKLSKADLSRAVLHIAKNRGQRLTRGLKDEKAGDDNKVKDLKKERQSMAATANETASRLRELGKNLGMPGAAHPAQLLENMQKALDAQQPGRGFTRLKKGRTGVPVFTRGLLELELQALLDAQATHYPDQLSTEVREQLQRDVFWEEEAKVPSVGKCRYGIVDANGDVQPRIARGSDLFQRKRIYEEVNNIRIISSLNASETKLNLEQRNTLAEALLKGETLSAAKTRKLLGLGKGATEAKTTLDVSDKRKGRKSAGKLEPHPIAAAMSKVSALDEWNTYDSETRETICELVRSEDDVEALASSLHGMGMTVDVINALSEARVPSGFSAAGFTATEKLFDQLKAAVISNYEAEERAGLTSTLNTERRERLPYYGELLVNSCSGGSYLESDKAEQRYGRIANPVVHVALNQIRKVANSYLSLYGKPEQICIELARDMNKSAEEREKDEKDAAGNRAKNEAYAKRLAGDKRQLNRSDLTRLKLHDMQKGECLYTGQPISMENLFDGSVEVDHILPRSVTHDDGIANLALCFKSANQDKGKRSPYEAFSAGYEGQDYALILKRALQRGGATYRRFSEDALERFQDQDQFRARFLNDTRYISKVANQYLSSVIKDPNGMIALNGRITSALRREWGLGSLIRDMMIEDGRLEASEVVRQKGGETIDELIDRRKRNDKIRLDHRHHLLDAIVAACTTRSDVQRLQTLVARLDDDDDATAILAELRRSDEAFKQAGICWRPDFRERVKSFLSSGGRGVSAESQPVTSVVPKADHDRLGQLHKASNYGLICEVSGAPGKFVVRDHVPLANLTKEQIDKLGVSDSDINAAKEAKAKGLRFWWGGNDPVTALASNLAKELEQIRERLLHYIADAPEEVWAEAKTENGREKAKVKWAIEKYTTETGRNRYTRVQVLSLRILKGASKIGGRPKQASPEGNNDRLLYYINKNGDRNIEVVSKLDANTPTFREAWRDGGRLLFALRKNDIVEMLTDPKDNMSRRGLFRMASFSGKGATDMEFTPLEDARSPRELPRTSQVRIASLKAFNERMPEMVRDATGRLRWKGPKMN